MVTNFIVDSPRLGAWNMAADQILLEEADRDAVSTLRIYQWREPTLSLGYFQRNLDRTLHQRSSQLSWVRRSTGGGAIVHDREMTYSLAMPMADRALGENRWLYRQIHRAMIESLSEFGITASAYGDSRQDRQSCDHVCTDPWLCFQRRTSEDLLVSGYKIAGSAQRRGKKAILQHGSLLLSVSSYAPELPGVNELSGKSVLQCDFVDVFVAAIARNLTVELTPAKWSESHEKRIQKELGARFGGDEWNLRR